MLTYTGIHITRNFGVPSTQDLAIHLMRICRFGGACTLFWPVGMHSLVVADLLMETGHPDLEVYGLLHDATEGVMADIPQPFKTDDYRVLSDRLEARIFRSFGLKPITSDVHKIVKQADIMSLQAEMWMIGPRGGRAYVETHGGRNEVAEGIMQRYLKAFNAEHCIDPRGDWVTKFEERLQVAIFKAQKGAYAETEAA